MRLRRRDQPHSDCGGAVAAENRSVAVRGLTATDNVEHGDIEFADVAAVGIDFIYESLKKSDHSNRPTSAEKPVGLDNRYCHDGTAGGNDVGAHGVCRPSGDSWRSTGPGIRIVK